jgi:starch synthase
MRILFAASEAVPFAKTGGLADVAGALPTEIAKLGHTTTLILPAYRQTKQSGLPLEPTGYSFQIPIGTKQVSGRILRSRLPQSDVDVLLVENDEYFDRPQLYGEHGHDYIDNCERFVFFSRAILEVIHGLDLQLDLVHLNDWQTALVAAYLKTEYRGVPGYENIASLYTIHNLAYQGHFWHWDMLLTGLDWKYFNWHQMEFYGHLNLMKTGLVFADRLSTVSPRYAQEIQTLDQGCGLEGVLQSRRHVLSGIINGVDYGQWNPEVDNYLPERFGPENFDLGKPACKAALQQSMGLPEREDVPVLAFVGRLASQKGCDLISRVLQEWLPTRDMQWVILGTGEPQYQEMLQRLAAQHGDRLAVRLEFSNALAHQIEAGADMFLMPSRYEPCGLNQLYSLKYGTVPIVRATGGLADTIVDLSPESLAHGTANGFQFTQYDWRALAEAIDRACAAFARPEIWDQLISNGMHQDWSWARSAQQYVDLYERTVASVRQPAWS